MNCFKIWITTIEMRTFLLFYKCRNKVIWNCLACRWWNWVVWHFSFQLTPVHEHSKHRTSAEHHESFTLRTYQPPCWKGLLSAAKSGAIRHIHVPKCCWEVQIIVPLRCHHCCLFVNMRQQELGQGAWPCNWLVPSKCYVLHSYVGTIFTHDHNLK